jgi:alpha-galactosidase
MTVMIRWIRRVSTVVGAASALLAPLPLRGAVLVPALLVLAGTPSSARAAHDAAPTLVERIRSSAPRAVAVDPAASDALRVDVAWQGDVATARVTNASDAPVAVREVILFDVAHGLAPDTRMYGEGLQMLAQTAGTISSPEDVGDYPDRSHYRLPEPDGFRRVYSLVVLEPRGAPRVLAGFAACRRFVGAFDISPERLRAAIDCEGLSLAPGASWELEPLHVRGGDSHDGLLAGLAREVARNHPRTAYPAPPAGWCSWYCFGPRVTAQDVLDNLAAIERGFPDLRFVQIDDGYQPTMGDWLDTGPGFGGRPVQEILREIKARGREPAIWLAPFVASPDAKILREHPDWFVKGDDGKPMPSDRVMFGGWRLGPWYVLDGTHPEVQAHLERLVRTIHDDWGVRYFKLDAIFWGMMHGGRLHDPKATRVEAYRRGMEAIRRGAGGGSYLLGCNHPIWPSLGLIDGSRSSLDIERNWRSVSRTGRENLLRAWQNGVLWWNDPDTLVQTGLPANEARFHATLVWATGGAMLAGDDLSRLPRDAADVVRALSRPTGVAARFADLSLEHGVVSLDGGTERHVFFNWGDRPTRREIEIEAGRRARDVWSGEALRSDEGRVALPEIPPHGAIMIEVVRSGG